MSRFFLCWCNLCVVGVVTWSRSLKCHPAVNNILQNLLADQPSCDGIAPPVSTAIQTLPLNQLPWDPIKLRAFQVADRETTESLMPQAGAKKALRKH